MTYQTDVQIVELREALEAERKICQDKNQELLAMSQRIEQLEANLTYTEGQLEYERKETDKERLVFEFIGLKNEKLEDQLEAVREAIGGASMSPQTGVSVVDDVKDLVKEGFTAGVEDFVRYTHNPIVAQKNEEIARLKALVKSQIDWLRDGDGAWHLHAKARALELEEACNSISEG
jgi:hypothetical protein